MTVRPSGTVTFQFTDIEGSTRRWEADPDAMRVALAAHDEWARGSGISQTQLGRSAPPVRPLSPQPLMTWPPVDVVVGVAFGR